MADSAAPRVEPAASFGGAIITIGSRIFRNYTFRTALQAIFTIWLVVTSTFILVRLLPSNPVQIYINNLMQSGGYTPEQAKAEAQLMFSAEFDRPIGEQYLQFLGNILHGNLGYSISSTGTPIVDIIARFLPWTLFCVGAALLISFVLGLLIGLLMAYWRNSPFDFVMTTISSFLGSIPNYLLAFLLIYLLGLTLNVISVASMRGAYSPGAEPGFTPAFI